MKNKIVKIGQLEVDLNELSEFLVEAKKTSYARGKAEVIKDNSKIFIFQKGDFHYQDNYDGYYQFSGGEIVRWKNWDGQRIWQMNYFGGMSPELEKLCKREELTEFTKRVYDFLKKTLLQVTPKMPFRGPKEAREMDLRYENIFRGDIEKFQGTENISFGSNTIGYSLNYHGGLIIPK